MKVPGPNGRKQEGKREKERKNDRQGEREEERKVKRRCTNPFSLSLPAPFSVKASGQTSEISVRKKKKEHVLIKLIKGDRTKKRKSFKNFIEGKTHLESFFEPVFIRRGFFLLFQRKQTSS